MEKPARELDRAFKSVNKIYEQQYKRKLKQFSRGSGSRSAFTRFTAYDGIGKGAYLRRVGLSPSNPSAGRKGECRARWGGILSEIRAVANLLPACTFNHIGRTANRAAHELGQKAMRSFEAFFCWAIGPYSPVDTALRVGLNTYSFRVPDKLFTGEKKYLYPYPTRFKSNMDPPTNKKSYLYPSLFSRVTEFPNLDGLKYQYQVRDCSSRVGYPPP
jgi:hypothetical protein